MNFYLDDGGMQLCGCPCTCCLVGDHPYDLEVVVVELDWTGVSRRILLNNGSMVMFACFFFLFLP